MPVNPMIQVAKGGYLILSALMSLLGLAMLIQPNIPMKSLCLAGGCMLILFGIVKLIGYGSRDLYRLAFEHDLSGGLTIIALGIFILLRSERLHSAIIMVLGLVIMIDACAKVQVAFDAKVFGIRKWHWIMTAAVLTGIVGFVLIFRASVGYHVPVRLLGLALITEAVQNCATILIAVKIIRRQDTNRAVSEKGE